MKFFLIEIDIMKDIYPKIINYFKDCPPLYGNLIIIILILLSSTFRLMFKEYNDNKKNMFILFGLIIIHFSIVLYLCKKKYKKIAYFVAYLPFIAVLIQITIMLYIIDDIFTETEEITQNN